MAADTAVPSSQRVVPGSSNLPVASYPKDVGTPASYDPAQVTATVVDSFNKALAAKDLAGIASHFVNGPDTYWRDHLALTWAFRTAKGQDAILELLQTASKSKDGFRLIKIAPDVSNPVRSPMSFPIDPHGTIPGVQFFITFETVHGSGVGVVRLVHQEEGWKIFSLYTRLEGLKGHNEGSFFHRPQGVQHGGQPGRKNWAERREAERNHEEGDGPTVLIVGAGQAGLTAAARLKALGVKSLIIDRNPRIGDNWRQRYHQLVLHDPVWYDHLPYIPFPPQWPIFTPKDKLAQFFESYAGLLELDVWTRTSLVSTSWDDTAGAWTVEVDRVTDDGKTERRTFHPKHVIQATGHSGEKNMPAVKGIDSFKGDVLCHSSEFKGAKPNSEGKKAVVVGSCNSAHDIAQDFLERGYDVTIVQRSTTCVWSSKGVTDIANAGVYEEGGPQVDDGDLLVHAFPSAVLKERHLKTNKDINELDQDILDGLAKAGFKVDRGPDEAGLLLKYFQRGGGYYIDVGASKLIAEGKIKIKQGQEIDEVLPNGLRFADGSELPADEVVFATGYQNMRTQTASMFGPETAERVGDVWGFNEEGEMKVIWQRSGHPGFWFHGGNLALCRFYSLPLALQIKGREAGLYKDGEL